MAIESVIANSDKVPGVYIRVSLGVGARAAGSDPLFVVLFGNKTSSGTMALETEYDCFSEDEARSLAGAGSELFWMFKAAAAANPGVPIKLMAVTASAGTAATGTITVTNSATSAGTVGVTVQGEEIEIPFASGEANTAVAAAINTAINNKSDWPVTAGVASGVVTLTARHAGPRGNFISFRCRIIAGTGTAVAASGVRLASGATSDDPQTALDAQQGVVRRFLVAPYSDATQLAKFKTHVDAQDEPEAGNRKIVVAGSLDTLANTTTLATGLNFSRGQLAWMEDSDLPPSMLAAALASFRAGAEGNDAAHNYCGEILPGLKPHFDKSDIPSHTELVSALNNGITPLTSLGSGEVVIVRSITTKSQDSASKPDYRVLDSHKVAVPDFIASDLELQFADSFGGMKASDNPPEGETPAPGVCTPAMVRDLVYDRLKFFEKESGLLDSGSVDKWAKSLVVELSKLAPGRFNIVVPADVVEWATQFAADIRQIG
jgi:phage tail sheath gpL-like